MKPYYERGGITIYCGDCLKVMPWLVGLGVVVDAVIVLQIVVIVKIVTSSPLLTQTIKNGLITPDCVWKKIPRATGSLYFRRIYVTVA